VTLTLPTKPITIGQLGGALLRRCRDDAAELRAAYDRGDAWESARASRERLRAWFVDLDADILDETDLVDLRRLLDEETRRLGSILPENRAGVLVTRMAAEALDDALGRRFFELFRNRRVRLEPGDPFPIVKPPLKQIFGGDLSSNPQSLEPAIHSLERLRILCAPTNGIEVWVDGEHADALRTLGGDSRIALLLPNGNLTDDLDFDTEPDPPIFLNVRPKDPERQRRCVFELLDRCFEARAAIVVLPELSLDAELAGAVRAWYEQHGRPFELLVCGSVHVAEETRLRNRSTTLLASGGTFEHRKFNRFTRPLPHATTGERIDHDEGVHTSPAALTACLARTCSFTVLICKDFLEPSAVAILEDLRLGLVLVPACSAKTEVFEDHAGHLAIAAQSVVAVANTADPGSPSPACCIVARPRARGAVEVVRRHQVDPPDWRAFALGAGTVPPDA
jgi:hypothetical protein